MKKKKKQKHSGFSNSKLFELLLVVFRKNPNKTFNYKQVSKILKIKELGVKIQLVDVMKEMAESNVLSEVRRGSYRLIQKTVSLVGLIKNTNKKGVFACVGAEGELFIPRELSLFALPGDEVEVLVFPKRKKKQEGEVVRVLKRKKSEFVGVIDNSSSNYFLIPDDRQVFFDVFLPPKLVKPSFLNKKVVVRVDGWDEAYKNPVGRVVRVLGDVHAHESEMSSIVYDYGFALDFPKSVIDELKALKLKISTSDLKGRVDIRKTKTFTIDPENAKDFDDAISVKKLSNGNWEVGVHIADVAQYVSKGGALDEEACLRGTSVYLVDRVIPMLPELISNDLCSLKPSVDRLAYSVFFEMSESAKLIGHKISKSIIHSDKRFTYQSAQEVINKKTGVFAKELLLLDRLSKILRKNRQENGSINFESSEVSFVLDEKQNPIDVSFKEVLPTNHLIEEFMLLANKTVAKAIGFPKKNAPLFIYRVHDLPDEEKINSLAGVVKKLGYTINNKNPKSLSSSLNGVLAKSKGKEEQQMIETLTVRSMSKAIYTTNNIGHYGLAFDYYSHFTSPIRRYPDLIVHRLLEKHLNKKPVSIKKADLENICRHCSEKEKQASQAERDSIKYMQVKFLKNKVGEIYKGVVSGVTEWGLYVEISENKCEGLVKISSLKDDHYIYNDSLFSLVGYKTKNKYQLGDVVKIKIKNADLEKKQLDFVLV